MDIVETLNTIEIDQFVSDFVWELTKVSPFEMAVEFLSNKEKDKIAELIEKFEEKKEDLKKKFKI